ncbi:hypothetical protein ACVIHH_001299 [Bradyrhizobium sp. USDA 4518]|nr:hypothetical protein [Bradyrhizobium sp. USDA 4545]MCP1918767.1 hypothetical protein [Bradyrhizobium sp. USDA 4532]
MPATLLISNDRPFDDPDGEELLNDEMAWQKAVTTVRDIGSNLDLDKSNRWSIAVKGGTKRNLSDRRHRQAHRLPFELASRLQVKIGRIESGQFLQFVVVQNAVVWPLDLHDTFLPQFLQRAVDVDRRKSETISKIGLRNREVEITVARSTDSPQSTMNFGEKVGHTLVRGPAADIDDPFPKNRRVNERFAPKRTCHIRALLTQGLDRFMRDEAKRAGCQRREIVVHDVEVEALQIRYFAGNVQREDLPLAVLRDFCTVRKSFGEKATFLWPAAIGDNNVLGRDLAFLDRQLLKCLNVIAVEPVGGS